MAELECDRCGESYKSPPVLVMGRELPYLICPLCVIDLEKKIDRWINNRKGK